MEKRKKVKVNMLMAGDVLDKLKAVSASSGETVDTVLNVLLGAYILQIEAEKRKESATAIRRAE